jgi:NAD(P)-dependent dehydrogenase (short-subunit alcohol dehydrogenase family)
MVLSELKNRNILVTGASQGIGKAIATLLMQNGAKVALHCHSNTSSALEMAAAYPETGSSVFQADLANSLATVELWQQAVGAFGRIDSVVLNAGIYEEHKPDSHLDDWIAIWKKTMAVNLDAAGLLTKLGISHFKEQGGGRFVYIASRAAFRGETEEYMAYAASKGGLVSLGRTVARSFGKYNIKSFILAPGFVRTKMADQFISVYGKQRVLEELALKELTEPEDLAPLVALMCSGLMDHATGTTIDMNAGSHIR